MLVNCNSLEIENISHSVTLVPRLDYSINLLSQNLEILKEKRQEVKKQNQILLEDYEHDDKTHLKSLDLEQTVLFCFETLLQIKKQVSMISGVNTIPEVLPPIIPMIRTVSAKLYDIFPNCSQKLSELSVHLGSIVLDSAALTKARFDFSRSNEESSIFLDEVKLIVDSKLRKQYPNLDFSK
ncbi:MAG: hypothetical protein K5790_04355 [Nitrosopumilus sp.]|uniref:hypothetical protein n=1 Tax=Nitrosopumilus sp. TaxID=2024843 RepID=UPI00247DED65|nr:hypothetical protein [Nitrosopumilus sp.]MCV0392511.1 hypothetical protein [Nitrosopumilus sp.]